MVVFFKGWLSLSQAALPIVVFFTVSCLSQAALQIESQLVKNVIRFFQISILASALFSIALKRSL